MKVAACELLLPRVGTLTEVEMSTCCYRCCWRFCATPVLYTPAAGAQARTIGGSSAHSANVPHPRSVQQLVCRSAGTSARLQSSCARCVAWPGSAQSALPELQSVLMAAPGVTRSAPAHRKLTAQLAQQSVQPLQETTDRRSCARALRCASVLGAHSRLHLRAGAQTRSW